MVVTTIILLIVIVSIFIFGCIADRQMQNNKLPNMMQQVLNENTRYITVPTYNMSYKQVNAFLNMLPDNKYRLITATSKNAQSINCIILEKING